MMHLGKVTRVDHVAGKVWATFEELSGDKREFGPMMVAFTWWSIYGYAIDTTAGVYSHGHSTNDTWTALTNGGPPAMLQLLALDEGDIVVAVQVGLIKENLLVVGKMAAGYDSGGGSSYE